MVFYRALQGFSGGVMIPISFTVANTMLPPSKRPLGLALKGDLVGIVKAIALSRAVMRNIRQNLFFAFVYNALGIPIAAGILYPFFGILLSPMIGKRPANRIYQD